MHKVLLSLLLLASALTAAADPAIPDVLAPWVPWVLHPQDRRACPLGLADAPDTPPGSDGSRVCAWPGRLALDLDGQGGRFSQGWEVYAETWVPLPGDEERWPQDLKLGDSPQPVVRHGGRPAVKLPPGRHTLTGRFDWQSLPDGLAVPAETGLLTLTLAGKPVAEPRVDRGGRLWLGETDRAAGAEEGDRLSLKVYRRIEDDIPLRATARLELDVSGLARQVRLGPVLLAGGVPLRVQSPLPARLDADGWLTVQVRPGSWVLEVEERHPGAVSSLARPDSADPWPAREIWSFAARPDLRQVELGGAPPVDPRQLGVPSDWQRLPAYALGHGGALQLAERRRGDPDPGPDRLSLDREIWLDLGGGGYSLRDRISGQLARSWRLTLAPPLELGQVRVDGEPQPIGRLAADDPPGVEVRRGRLDLSADSRMTAVQDGLSRSIPASAWNLRFDAIGARLYLPPGWDLLAVSGTDNPTDAWLNRWTLLDLFLVLIVALGAGRLWGWPWGLLALAALGLTWRAPGAPQLVWLSLLAAVALLRLLPERQPRPGRVRLRTLVSWYYRLSLIALLLVGLPFLVSQVRTGLYPHLERGGVGLGGAVGPARPAAAIPWKAATARLELDLSGETDGTGLPSAPVQSSAERPGAAESQRRGAPVPPPAPQPRPVDEPEPGALVQSGAGVPDWSWRTQVLGWNGSVDSGESARIWLLSPGWHLIWSLLGGALVALLGLRMANLVGRRALPPPDRGAPRPDRPSSPSDGPERAARRALGAVLAAALALASLGSLGPRAVQAGDLPGPDLLRELKARLQEPPDCLPDCVDLSSLSLEATPDRLRMELTLDAAVAVSAPVPGGPGAWVPAESILDGAPLDGLRRDGRDRLVVPLAPGRHRLVLSGPLSGRNRVEIPLPLRPRQVRVQTDGWTLDGLDPAGRAGSQVRLVRVEPAAGADAGAQVQVPLAQGALPPLLLVDRTLRLGLDWRLSTRVTRLSPSELAVAEQVPLWPGESVQTPGLAVSEGTVLVNLAPGETETGWVSSVQQTPSLKLSAASDPQLTESWSVDASPSWHLDWTGIAPVHRVSDGDRWLPSWRPLPGESLELRPSRPTAVPGPTLTIDRVDFVSTPGRRGRDGALELAIRSTQGGTHPLRLPQGAVPSLLRVDGRDLPLPGSEGAGLAARLELPLVPGSQSVTVRWHEPAELGTLFSPATPDLGAPAVNLSLTAQMPGDRWILFVTGPRIGPVVLFWGVLLVLAALALGLGQVRLVPLRTLDWLLLGIGLSLSQPWVLVLVGGWLLTLGLRRRLPIQTPRWRYNLTQVGLALLTLAALAALVGAVSEGLLGAPDMQIMGNGSAGNTLHWYLDRGGPELPRIQVLSVPMWVYRGLMLAWALWLAARLLDWLRWGWEGYAQPMLWREREPRVEG